MTTVPVHREAMTIGKRPQPIHVAITGPSTLVPVCLWRGRKPMALIRQRGPGAIHVGEYVGDFALVEIIKHAGKWSVRPAADRVFAAA